MSRTMPFRTLELRLTDWLFEWRGPLTVDESPVVLVAISDQADYEIAESWPWPRNYHARLVDNLNAAGARVIGFDVTFIQPDDYSAANDSLFARAIERHGNVVLAGDIRAERRGGTSHMVRRLTPYRELQASNPNPWGIISNPLDEDGFVRRYRPFVEHLGQRHHAFGLELVRRYLDLDSLVIADTPTHYELGFTRIPKFDHHTMLINYHGGLATFTEYSYEQIIDDGSIILNSDREFFGIEHPDDKQYGDFDDPGYGLLHTGDLQDKIVIVGATMPELQDFHPTPYSPQLPGYEIHANAIQTILSAHYIRPLGPALRLAAVVAPVVLISIVTIYKGVLAGFAGLVLLSVSLTGTAQWLFSYRDIRMELVLPMVPLLLGYATSSTYSFVTEQMEKRRVRSLFGSYVSPELVNMMIESGEEPRLGGEEAYISAFFSDIQSFSAFSEQLEPVRLVELINEYLTEMTTIITEEQGTLDKYIGDAIVAFFGAPIALADHALRACVASQRMILQQNELRRKWSIVENEWPSIVGEMRTRIGINTGTMVTGNMGSSIRFNYTMMGDDVNLAARCESGAKTYGVYTMVTERTCREAQRYGDDCVFRYLDRVVVMGRTQPVDIYEIVGLRTHVDRSTLECIDLYETAMAAYRHQRWDQAAAHFRQSARLEPLSPDMPGVKTNPSLVMIERCAAMRQTPPGDDWDGVFVMDSK